jgi:hypothetical protein
MLYRGVERLGLLQALAADWRFQSVTGQKALTALVALQAIHLAFWFPAKQSHNAPLFHTSGLKMKQ